VTTCIQVSLVGRCERGGVLRTTVPTISSDVDFFPGIKLKWGFGHMITTEPVAEGRSAGSLTWAGIYNTYYWIDPKKRIAAVFMTQVLPFADVRVLRVYRQFERGIYAAIKAGYVKAG
jgi:methyl acetate hydrolase